MTTIYIIGHCISPYLTGLDTCYFLYKISLRLVLFTVLFVHLLTGSCMVKFVLLEWSLSPNFFVPRYSFLFFLKKQSQCWDELKWFWIKLLVLLSLSKNQDRFFSLSFLLKILSPFNNFAFNPRAYLNSGHQGAGIQIKFMS